ncbi:MAG: DUF3450 domain-containing protein [Myxococcota bacterium]|jgi:hypothetical protein|nr:DUF3450 domain-containing protein [Myxococcota bacterium]
MFWTARKAAARIGLGAAVVLVGSMAVAQEGDLGKLVDTRKEGNVDAAATQKRIDAISDETDSLLGKYRTTLKQIDSIEQYNAQILKLISAQEEEIGSLGTQVGQVQSVGRSVTPLMMRMVDAIEKFVELDVPFLIDERTERIDKLRKVMERADVTTPEKFRSIMEAYQIENEYGRTIEAYRASLVIGDKETTVDFLRFGRIALVYQSLDETLQGRWDQQSRSWVALDGSFRSAIRHGLKIARKQSAPDLINLPLPAPSDARG